MAVDEFNGVGKKEMDIFTYIYIEKRKKKSLLAGATTLSSLPLPPYLHLNNSVLRYQEKTFHISVRST